MCTAGLQIFEIDNCHNVKGACVQTHKYRSWLLRNASSDLDKNLTAVRGRHSQHMWEILTQSTQYFPRYKLILYRTVISICRVHRPHTFKHTNSVVDAQRFIRSTQKFNCSRRYTFLTFRDISSFYIETSPRFVARECHRCVRACA